MSEYSVWNRIYDYINPIAFSIFDINVHWYGITYVGAMLVALLIAKAFISYDKARFPFSKDMLDSFFIWVEIGVILGGRLGYIIIYSPDSLWYLSHPWQIFNPYHNGIFVGIAGFSYHGALAGFLVAAALFSFFKKQNFLLLMDLSAISIPLGYVFGRIGNFLNKELFGREITESSGEFAKSIGILVDGQLRYPSQLFEGLCEGVLVFIFLMLVYRYGKGIASKAGSLAVLYGIAYSLARFACEFFREADSQMGYFALNFSMGQILSIAMFAFSLILAMKMLKSKRRNL